MTYPVHSRPNRSIVGRLPILSLLLLTLGTAALFAQPETRRRPPVAEAIDSASTTGVYLGMKGGVARYEYARRSHHHHMVCTGCGASARCGIC